MGVHQGSLDTPVEYSKEEIEALPIHLRAAYKTQEFSRQKLGVFTGLIPDLLSESLANSAKDHMDIQRAEEYRRTHPMQKGSTI